MISFAFRRSASPHARLRPRHGFTLVEIIVTMVIAVIIGVAFTRLRSTSRFFDRRTPIASPQRPRARARQMSALMVAVPVAYLPRRATASWFAFIHSVCFALHTSREHESAFPPWITRLRRGGSSLRLARTPVTTVPERELQVGRPGGRLHLRGITTLREANSSVMPSSLRCGPGTAVFPFRRIEFSSAIRRRPVDARVRSRRHHTWEELVSQSRIGGIPLF